MASQYIAQGGLHSCTCIWKNQHSWSQCPGGKDKGADVDKVITNSGNCFQQAGSVVFCWPSEHTNVCAQLRGSRMGLACEV